MQIEANQRHDQVQRAQQARPRKNLNQKARRAASKQECREYGDPQYVCFKIGQLEFYTEAAAYGIHCTYFKKALRQMHEEVQNRQQQQQQQQEGEQNQNQNVGRGQEREKQIVMRLSRDTLPSVLLLLIKFIEGKMVFDGESLDIQTAFECVKVADQLKMRVVERHLLNQVVVQMIDKTNAIDFLNAAHLKIQQKKKLYRGELVIVQPRLSNNSERARKRKRKRRRRRRRSSQSDSDGESEPGEDSESENSNESSCDDVGDSDEESSSSEEEAKEPNLVQVDMPWDTNDAIEEIKDSEEIWAEFCDYCVSLSAANLHYIMRTRKNDLTNQISPEVIELIAKRNVQFYRSNPYHDNSMLIELMMSVRKCKSVFELLALEKAKILAAEKLRREELQQNGHDPKEQLLTWSVTNFNNYFYKQSDSIQIQGANWRLALSYFKKQSNCLKVEVKIMNSPFDTKQAKEYFKKSDFAVPSNLDLQKLDPMAQFEVEDVEIENQQQRVNALNAAAIKFTNHAIVSFVASVDLFEGGILNEGRIHSMICSQKQPVQLAAFEDFDIELVQDGIIDVSLKFQVEDIHSALLLYICKNFSCLIYEPELRHLSKDDLKLLLKHKYLNVTQEDEVIKAVCNWLEGQQISVHHPKHANVPKKTLGLFAESPENSEDSDSQAQSLGAQGNRKAAQAQKTLSQVSADLNEILHNVNWDYVSLPCLLDVMRSEPLMRKCPAFQQALKAQFQVRLNRNNADAIEAAHSQFNNEPRFCYKHNLSQRNLYPEDNEASLSERGYVQAKTGQKSQFQLLYPVQLYPDFLAHLADCMVNPIDIVKSTLFNSPAAISNSLPAPKQNRSAPKHGQSLSDHYVGSLARNAVPASLSSQQSTRKRQLQQQLLKKQLEAKQIADQLHAIEYLDNLRHKKQKEQQSSVGGEQLRIIPEESKDQLRAIGIDERIASAKQDFKMRVANSQKKRRPRGGEPGAGDQANQEGVPLGSGRPIIDAAPEDPESSIDSNRSGEPGNGESVKSESDPGEPQLDSCDEEEEKVEFQASQRDSIVEQVAPVRRLSDAVQEHQLKQQQQQEQQEQDQVQKVEPAKPLRVRRSSKEMQEEWEKLNRESENKAAGKNKIFSLERDSSGRSVLESVEEEKDSDRMGSDRIPDCENSYISGKSGESEIVPSQQNASSVLDYSELKADRRMWSDVSGRSQNDNNSAQLSDCSKSSLSSMDGSDSGGQSLRTPGSAMHDQRHSKDSLNYAQEESEVKSMRNHSTDQQNQMGSSKGGLASHKRSDNKLKFNTSLSEDRNLNELQNASHSDNGDRVRLEDEIQRRASYLQMHIRPHSGTGDTANSYTQTEEVAREVHELAQQMTMKTTSESEAQTELDMEFMTVLLDQLKQKEAIEAQLFLANQKLFLLENVQRESHPTQTEDVQLESVGAQCDPEPPKPRAELTRESQLIQVEIEPTIKETSAFEEQPLALAVHDNNQTEEESQASNSVEVVPVEVAPAVADAQVKAESQQAESKPEGSHKSDSQMPRLYGGACVNENLEDLDPQASFFQSSNSVSSYQSNKKEQNHQDRAPRLRIDQSSAALSGQRRSRRPGSIASAYSEKLSTPSKAQGSIKGLTVDIFAKLPEQVPDSQAKQAQPGKSSSSGVEFDFQKVDKSQSQKQLSRYQDLLIQKGQRKNFNEAGDCSVPSLTEKQSHSVTESLSESCFFKHNESGQQSFQRQTFKLKELQEPPSHLVDLRLAPQTPSEIDPLRNFLENESNVKISEAHGRSSPKEESVGRGAVIPGMLNFYETLERVPNASPKAGKKPKPPAGATSRHSGQPPRFNRLPRHAKNQEKTATPQGRRVQTNSACKVQKPLSKGKTKAKFVSSLGMVAQRNKQSTPVVLSRLSALGPTTHKTPTPDADRPMQISASKGDKGNPQKQIVCVKVVDDSEDSSDIERDQELKQQIQGSNDAHNPLVTAYGLKSYQPRRDRSSKQQKSSNSRSKNGRQSATQNNLNSARPLMTGPRVTAHNHTTPGTHQVPLATAQLPMQEQKEQQNDNFAAGLVLDGSIEHSQRPFELELDDEPEDLEVSNPFFSKQKTIHVSSKPQRRKHEPPRRNRPQSQANCVNSKMSSLLFNIPIANIREMDYSDEEMAKTLTEKQTELASSELTSKPSISDQERPEATKNILSGPLGVDQQVCTQNVLDLIRMAGPEAIPDMLGSAAAQGKLPPIPPPMINLGSLADQEVSQSISGSGSNQQPHLESQEESKKSEVPQRLLWPEVHSSANVFSQGSGGPASNLSLLQITQGDLFSQRDKGLACFNILDHLKLGSQNAAPDEAPEAQRQDPYELMRPDPEPEQRNDDQGSPSRVDIDLSRLRESHINQSSSAADSIILSSDSLGPSRQ